MMAIARPGGVVDAISGNLGGANFAQTKNGLVIRRRASRADSRTTEQLIRRAVIPSLQRRWVYLTEDQKLTWATAAREYVRTNRLGLASTLSAYQLFLSVNAGYPGAPAVYYVNPPNMTATVSPTAVTLTAQQGAAITLTFSSVVNNAFHWLILEGSQPHSERPRAHWSFWRRFYAEVNNASPLVITADWAATLGTHSFNQRIAVRLTQRHTQRLPSVPVIATALVAAP